MIDTVIIRGHTVEVLNRYDYVLRVHIRAECDGRPCTIHAPTNHTMRFMPLVWRHDRGIFERLCQHGVGHPDPDQEAYWFQLGGQERVDTEFNHGCCGYSCCVEMKGGQHG